MKQAFGLHVRYFCWFIALFLAECTIAGYFHDQLVRPYFGDLLVVILLYCFVKSFFNFNWFKTAMGVLLFSYVIEVSQYFHLIVHLGLKNSLAAKLILGSGFAWMDLVAYTLGTAVILVIESRSAATMKNAA
ncbi:DUF2809 domain-containing protein [Flavobacterium sp.]|uniref:ribosomal maturation YjgA family protein n=1 Tax=Flavobacterium sp. TaxID=239 RepID=UPI0026163A38|nr:DUF2809 domain-containing protein [Flavobacterium sp.]